MTYTICFYRNGAMIHETDRPSRDAAELMALEGLREGAEVTIYRNGKALKGWDRRMA